jgi:perosamine synthetase
MKNKRYIRLFKPSVDNSEIRSISKVFKKAWLGYGEQVKKFEKKFSKFIGTKYAVGLNSCTSALHLSLKVNNFQKRKKVLVPSLTFSATAAAILYNDLIPVFVDINENDLNMSFEDLKKKYTKDCVAVMAVHFGGHPCKMDKIVPWAKKKKLIVIEDCAHTCGGTYKGKKLGNWGDFSCFSFEDKKVMTTGDGGMLCTNNKKKYIQLKSLSFHGWDTDPWTRHKKNKSKKNWYYEIKQLGYKSNMNNVMASIGIEQLKKMKSLNRKRILILKRYIAGLRQVKQISYAWNFSLKNSCYWLFSIKVKKRDNFMNFLRKKGISSGVHLMPLPLHPIYRKYNKGVQGAISTWENLVSLPFFPEIKKNEIDYVIKNVKDYFKKKNKVLKKTLA